MNSNFGILFVFSLSIFQFIRGSPINATYDQRQNGKVNVHISIKDVAIILQSESVLSGNEEVIKKRTAIGFSGLLSY